MTITSADSVSKQVGHVSVSGANLQVKSYIGLEMGDRVGQFIVLEFTGGGLVGGVIGGFLFKVYLFIYLLTLLICYFMFIFMFVYNYVGLF